MQCWSFHYTKRQNWTTYLEKTPLFPYLWLGTNLALNSVSNITEPPSKSHSQITSLTKWWPPSLVYLPIWEFERESVTAVIIQPIFILLRCPRLSAQPALLACADFPLALLPPPPPQHVLLCLYVCPLNYCLSLIGSQWKQRSSSIWQPTSPALSYNP